MSAEGKPQSDRSFMARPLEWLARLVVRFPVATLVLAGVATAVALFLTATRLGFRTSRAELLNPKSEFNQRWIEYTKEFGDKEDVVFVVEGDGPENVVPVLDELAATLAEDGGKNYSAVLAAIDLSKIRAKGLHYLKPDDLTADRRLPGPDGPRPPRRLEATQPDEHGQLDERVAPARRRRAARTGPGRHDRAPRAHGPRTGRRTRPGRRIPLARFPTSDRPARR